MAGLGPGSYSPEKDEIGGSKLEKSKRDFYQKVSNKSLVPDSSTNISNNGGVGGFKSPQMINEASHSALGVIEEAADVNRIGLKQQSFGTSSLRFHGTILNQKRQSQLPGPASYHANSSIVGGAMMSPAATDLSEHAARGLDAQWNNHTKSRKYCARRNAIEGLRTLPNEREITLKMREEKSRMPVASVFGKRQHGMSQSPTLAHNKTHADDLSRL